MCIPSHSETKIGTVFGNNLSKISIFCLYVLKKMKCVYQVTREQKLELYLVIFFYSFNSLLTKSFKDNEMCISCHSETRIGTFFVYNLK